MSLARAIAHLISERLGVACFEADLANREKVYPWVEVVEIDRDTAPLGCGGDDYQTEDPESGERTSVKVLEHRTAVRLTVHAAGTAQAAGGDIAVRVLGQIVGALEDAKRGRDPVVVTDPETSEDEHVTGLAYAGRTFLPPDSGGEPVVHRAAVSYRFTHRSYRKRPVEHRMDNVRLRIA